MAKGAPLTLVKQGLFFGLHLGLFKACGLRLCHSWNVSLTHTDQGGLLGSCFRLVQHFELASTAQLGTARPAVQLQEPPYEHSMAH